MNVTEEIKARLDIVDFIGQYVPLKKAGRNYKALCPFHSEKTPSFFVFPDTQHWRCFGACAEGGDIFTFVTKHEGLDFPQALRLLAERAGVELVSPTPQQAQIREAHERLRALLAEAAAFFHRQLLQAPNAAHARAYVEQRGLHEETVAQFRLGYAPDSWDATMNFLLGRGFARQDLIDGGLLVLKDDGSAYDRFRGRLMIPICDVQGEVVGFGARALSADAEPKYLNSPQTPIFDKSRLLFGLSQARRAIRESETAVIVEGYMDVMQAHQAGFFNVIAQMGTALTEPQLRLLARYARRLILALDPDTAGQMATERGREVVERVSKVAALQAGEEGVWGFDTAEREYHARLTAEFDARGMITYESRLGFDIRVLTLPEGKDPDDLIREAPQEWAALLEQALPIVEYVIQRTISSQNLDDPKVKSGIARQIVPLIEGIADRVERDHYRQRLARLLKVSEEALFPGRITAGRRAPSSRSPSREEPLAQESAPLLFTPPTHPRETFCLTALIRYPRLIYRVNRILAEHLTPEQFAAVQETSPNGGFSAPAGVLSSSICAADFTRPEHRAIFQAWQAALEQDEVEPLIHLRESLDPLLRQMVDSWLERPLDALLRDVTPLAKDLSPRKVYEAAIDSLLSLRKERIKEQLNELWFLFRESGDSGNSLTLWEHRPSLDVLLKARKQIERACQR